ncbi:MAG: ComEA family DNA-binding protein [Pseudomonadales bacterium]
MIGFFKVVLVSLLLTLSTAALAVDGEEAVNINKADAATLARVLKGVGEARARDIVRYREEHGHFVDIYELANVKGIGERVVEANAARMVLRD